MNNVSELNMYGKLLKQNLFQGLSRDDLEEIVAHTKFGFHKCNDGEHIATEGEPCRRLIMLTDGSVEAHTTTADKGFLFIETLHSPYTLQPERLFGLSQRYTTTFHAKGKCNLITLDKEEVLRLTSTYFVFQLNILNILSTKSQKALRAHWAHVPSNLRQRITRFFDYHCNHPAGEKLIYIKMTRLAEELNDSRLNISKELNKMQDEHLITLARGRIIIPALEKLLAE